MMAGASTVPPSAGSGCDVWLTGDDLSFVRERTRGVPGLQDQPALGGVVLEAGQGAVGDLPRPLQREDVGLAQVFQNVAEQEDDHLVRDDEDPLTRVVAADLVDDVAEPLDDVRPRLAAGRAVVELAEPGAPVRLLGKALADTALGESVEDAELALTEALVRDPRQVVESGG